MHVIFMTGWSDRKREDFCSVRQELVRLYICQQLWWQRAKWTLIHNTSLCWTHVWSLRITVRAYQSGTKI